MDRCLQAATAASTSRRLPSRAWTAPARETRSSAALPCFWVKACPNGRPFAAPISTQPCPRLAWEHRNLSTTARVSTPSGPLALEAPGAPFQDKFLDSQQDRAMREVFAHTEVTLTSIRGF